MTDMFVITQVSREDILAHFMDKLTPEQQQGKEGAALRARVSQITDGQMRSLATKMAGDYVEQLYWIQIGILAEDLVKQQCKCDPDEHDCTEHRVYLCKCDDCKNTESECKLSQKGICSVCGEVVE